jgi:uroporphyrin-III C-methyltransferase / precorrin-2 dehydrogenase / sirohydrochlorin ferrochelatase
MSDKPPPRQPMRGLASLPLFFDLAGKRVLLAGGAPEAAWKAELLQAAGARVDVFSAAPSADMQELAAQAPAVTLIGRDWTESDFTGATLAVGDCPDADEAARFAAAARRARVPVNVIDKPNYCDVQFGTIIDRSPLVVAISTSGAAPVFALALRGRLEALLPASLKHWAEAAQVWRPKLTNAPVRRRFWELFTARALTSHLPDEQNMEELIARAHSETQAAPRGTIALIGLADTDPELLTLKALRLLQAAESVFHDRAVAPAIVEIARRESAKIVVDTDAPPAPQMIAQAQAGARVAWLIAGTITDANLEIFRAAGCAVDIAFAAKAAGNS